MIRENQKKKPEIANTFPSYFLANIFTVKSGTSVCRRSFTRTIPLILRTSFAKTWIQSEEVDKTWTPDAKFDIL